MKRIDSLLSPFVKRLGIDGACRIEEVRKAWHDIFGEPLALHMWPSKIEGRELIINVDSPLWLQQISFFKSDIIRKLQPFDIQDVRMRIGKTRLARRGVRESRERQSVPLDRDAREFIETVTSEIRDAELKNAMARALERSFSMAATSPKKPAEDDRE